MERTKEVRKRVRVTNPKNGASVEIDVTVDFRGCPEAKILEWAARTLIIGWQAKFRPLVTAETKPEPVTIRAADVGRRAIDPREKARRELAKSLVKAGWNEQAARAKALELIPPDADETDEPGE